jgi:hypothetical protein
MNRNNCGKPRWGIGAEQYLLMSSSAHFRKQIHLPSHALSCYGYSIGLHPLFVNSVYGQVIDNSVFWESIFKKNVINSQLRGDMAERLAKKSSNKGTKRPRNPFALAARKRVAGPIRDRSEKRLQNKQRKEETTLGE